MPLIQVVTWLLTLEVKSICSIAFDLVCAFLADRIFAFILDICFSISALAVLETIIDDNTETVDESYCKPGAKWVPSKKKWYNPFTWFNEGAHWEDEWIEKYVDKVDMNQVASDYIIPFRESLAGTKQAALEHIKSETERLKEHLKLELVKIDNIFNEKLDMLSKTEADNKAKADEIKQKERNLKWLVSIQDRVNSIIKF